MATQANHHFVPQYYFRNFSQDGRRINLLNKRTGRIVEGASIRHQCSRHKFYVANELEALFADFEGKHARAIRRVFDAVYLNRSEGIDVDTIVSLCHAVLFQRARTVHEAEKHAPAEERMHLEFFKLHLLESGEKEMHDRLVEADRRGQVKVTADRRQLALRSIAMASESLRLIFDLEIRAIFNRTDYPFLFGDAPVVYYNSHLRKVTERGVLGLQTPGLQIFYPLSSDVCLLLIDGAKYRGRFVEDSIFEVTSRSDVSQLNVLQLQNCWENIYFESGDDQEYVVDLWRAHRNSCHPITAKVENRMMCIDDDPEPQEVLHGFEPQLPFDLHLSFIEAAPIEARGYKFERRSPELVESDQFEGDEND